MGKRQGHRACVVAGDRVGCGGRGLGWGHVQSKKQRPGES